MAQPHLGVRHAPTASGNSTGVVYRELHESVRHRLADLEALSATSDGPATAELAREELPKLIAGLRALLEAHQPDGRGHCPTCRRRLLRRRSPSPCRAYLSTYLCLLLAGDSGTVNGAAMRRTKVPTAMRHAS
ncbi:MAG: hypothetical protein ACRDRN_14575 [Sciscionella sp.]